MIKPSMSCKTRRPRGDETSGFGSWGEPSLRGKVGGKHQPGERETFAKQVLKKDSYGNGEVSMVQLQEFFGGNSLEKSSN